MPSATTGCVTPSLLVPQFILVLPSIFLRPGNCVKVCGQKELNRLPHLHRPLGCDAVINVVNATTQFQGDEYSPSPSVLWPG